MRGSGSESIRREHTKGVRRREAGGGGKFLWDDGMEARQRSATTSRANSRGVICVAISIVATS